MKRKAIFVHFSDRLVNPGCWARPYYADRYSHLEGYTLPPDWFELPVWIAYASALLPTWDQEVLIVRNVQQARAQLWDQHGPSTWAADGLDKPVLLFSAMDKNAKLIRRLIEGLPVGLHAVIGGYVDLPATFGDLRNVWTLDSIFELYTVMDDALTEGQFTGPDYSIFARLGMATAIPRLTLSSGCLHNCRMCTITRTLTERTHGQVKAQLDAFKPMSFQLCYLDDKTFGQAANAFWLAEIREYILSYNPAFLGFIVQTTATAALGNLAVWKSWGVRYVEVGLEVADDQHLRTLRKPHRVKDLDALAAEAREVGISLIPNVILCIPGNRYHSTLGWISQYSDVISHCNLYTLCIYSESKGAEGWLSAEVPADRDEGLFSKSWLTPEAVRLAKHTAITIMALTRARADTIATVRERLEV